LVSCHVWKGIEEKSEKAILTLVRSAGPRVQVAFEEGTQAQWLHDLLIGHADRVVVCNVRGRDATRNANDRIDADEMSKRLHEGSLKAVSHGAPEMLTLKELVRNYSNLVEDTTRVMLRIKAIFRARAIPTPGVSVYRPSQRKQWLARLEGGERVRATSLLTQLDTLLELRPKAKAAMIAAAHRQPGWKILRTIPFLGPVRVAYLLAIMRTPFRCRRRLRRHPFGFFGTPRAETRGQCGGLACSVLPAACVSPASLSAEVSLTRRAGSESCSSFPQLLDAEDREDVVGVDRTVDERVAGAYALAFLHVDVHGTGDAVLVAGALVGLDDDAAQAFDDRTVVHRSVDLGDDDSR
jgi:hypothetical protein